MEFYCPVFYRKKLEDGMEEHVPYASRKRSLVTKLYWYPPGYFTKVILALEPCHEVLMELVIVDDKATAAALARFRTHNSL